MNPAEYEFTAPDGTEYSGVNIRAFCRQHGLDLRNMYLVHYGARRHHKGWTCHAAGYVRSYSMANR